MSGFDGITWDDIMGIGKDMLASVLDDLRSGQTTDDDGCEQDCAPAKPATSESYGMQTGISITGNAAATSSETVKATADGLVALFRAAFDTHMDQETVRLALSIMSKSAGSSPGVEGMAITDCTLTGGG